uniref:PNK FHA domain-containing protein n=1 Tax=Arcella intermedia TaxID=1963864 RepID=A0A6B2L7Y9_9EUKA
MKELVASGYKVVIFTNQTAASKNKQLLNELLDKFKKIQSVVGIPMQYVVATKQDQYAKPSTALWELFVGKYNGNSAIDKTNSFFVGDAAGRTKNGKKDFSCSDRKFAYNIGLTFYTETEYFMKVEKEPFSWDGFDADGAVKLEKSKQEIQQELKHLRLAEKQEMIIMCGPPASGKSSFTKLMLVPKGYVAINRDTLGNMEKCLALARSSLESGLSVVIDNTNPKPASREAFIKIAKERGIPVRSFVMQANDLLTHHLNLLRVRMTNGKVSKIPDLVYRVFKKQWVFPAKSEGIDEILSIPFIPNFEDEQHRNLFKEFA